MRQLFLVYLIALLLAVTACAHAQVEQRPKEPTLLQKVLSYRGHQFSEVQIALGKPTDRFTLPSEMEICEFRYRYSCGYWGCVCKLRFLVSQSGTVEGGSVQGDCQ